MKKVIMFFLCFAIGFCQTVFAFAKAEACSHQREGRVGDLLVLEGEHSSYIRNESNCGQYYQRIYKIRVGSQIHEIVTDIYLEPGCEKYETVKMCLPIKLTAVGHESIEDTTSIAGESYDFAYSRSPLIIHH